MKIVKLKGGLGNQMFQYSYAMLLKQRTGETVYLDFSAYNDLKNDTIRVPRIVKFNLTLPAATNDEIKRICLLKHSGNSQTFWYRVGIFLEGLINKRYFIEPNRAYIDPDRIIRNNFFDGYWQSWRYVDEVREQIKKEFVPNYVLSGTTIETQKIMQKENSVFVGVRRGDYGEEASHYGSLEEDYYERAMEYIEQKVNDPVYYIFSNDIEWCKNNIKCESRTIKYRDKELQTDDFEELMLMASCKHAIIANSSYHWWGAALINYNNKIICCPEKWWFDEKPIDIIPGEWVKIRV